MSDQINIKYAPTIYQLKQSLEEVLFPTLQSYQEDFLQVSDLHSIWYAQYGNPNGTPVIVLHGGPGIGCGPNDMRFFDPNFYRIILMDQRGAKRSTPLGELQDNSPQHSIHDIEQLRGHLNIKKWLVFGGSWGSALSLLYGQAHPDRCIGFVLRGVFLATKYEADNIWLGMRDVFPELWEKMRNYLPEQERADLINAYIKRLLDPDPAVQISAALAFMEYDLKAGVLMFDVEKINRLLADEKSILGATIFAYYYKNNFFLQNNQILDNIDKIKHLPANIIHGRYDIICRLKSGYELAKHWPKAELTIVPDAGHTTAEPNIAKNLIAATERMKNLAY